MSQSSRTVPIVTQDEDGTVVVTIQRITPPADELVRLPGNFERAAARKLVASGALAATQIGRGTYAKRSDILALVDRNPIVPKAREVRADNDPRTAYAALVGGKAGAR